MLSRRMMARHRALVCWRAGAVLPARISRHPGWISVGSSLVLTAADGEVCATSTSAQIRPRLRPGRLSSEPVVSATLARLDATADLVMVLTRPDVVVHGASASRTARATVRSDGRELSRCGWRPCRPGRPSTVCASYRAPEGDGRFVVHRPSRRDLGRGRDRRGGAGRWLLIPAGPRCGWRPTTPRAGGSSARASSPPSRREGAEPLLRHQADGGHGRARAPGAPRRRLDVRPRRRARASP